MAQSIERSKLNEIIIMINLSLCVFNLYASIQQQVCCTPVAEPRLPGYVICNACALMRLRIATRTLAVLSKLRLIGLS